MEGTSERRSTATGGGPDRDVATIDRRTFVKGSLVGAAIGAATAGSFGLFKQLTLPDPFDAREVAYLGAHVLPESPAPRGLALIPVRVNEEGLVEGVPETDGTNHLDALRYCGHERSPGVFPGSTSDNVFRYAVAEEKLLKAGDSAAERYWYLDRLGEPVRATDFAARAAPIGASVRWRSEGVDRNVVLPLMLLKLDPETIKGVDESELGRFMDLDHGLVAFSAICTHFCCVPGFQEDPLARSQGWWDLIYCSCHHSRFDPTRIQTYRFVLREPRE